MKTITRISNVLGIIASIGIIGRVDGANAFQVLTVPSQRPSTSPPPVAFLGASKGGRVSSVRKQASSPGGDSAASALRLSGGVGDTAAKSVVAKLPTFSKKLLAEFLGTFLIVHIGCATVCAAIFASAQTGLWQIAAVWGLAVTVAIACTAGISGAHLNPAVTVALALLRGELQDKDESGAKAWLDLAQCKRVAMYILAQLTGAITAGFMNFGLYSEKIVEFEKASGFLRGSLESIESAKAFGEYWSVSSWETALFAEALGTSILAFVIFSLTNKSNSYTNDKDGKGNDASILIPPLIGGTVAMLISFIAPLTQAGFNPARDFGPRIVTAIMGWGNKVSFKGWWVYVVGPIIGAISGGWLADRCFFRDN